MYSSCVSGQSFFVRKEYGYRVFFQGTDRRCAACVSASFLRGKRGEKKALLQEYADFRGTLVFYSAPQDTDADIALLYETLGEREACAVREITKMHESTEYFTLSAGLAGEKRGEYVLLVKGAQKRENPLNLLSERDHIAHYKSLGMSEKDALKAAAKDRGVSKSELYKFTIRDNER